MSRVAFRMVVACMVAGAATVVPVPARAQTDAIRVCYVPGSGTIYRIGAADTRPSCAAGHVAFAWPASPQLSSAARRSPTGDPYPQYLLADGVRQSNGGFAVTDDPSTVGTIAASGPGKRLLWYPEKAAFRAGRATGLHWDDDNIGFGSTALGVNATASGSVSTALGYGTTASGGSSTAFGIGSTASGPASTALGGHTSASGFNSTAMGVLTKASGHTSTAFGDHTTASGDQSTAMGRYASTNGLKGAFVYGDASTNAEIKATLSNQFVVRAQHIWLGRNNSVGSGWSGFIETSTGASLSWGGTWINSSDAAKKENFAAIDGEAVLEKLAALPIRAWNYKDEEPAVRHLGPTAQDFHAAFGLGNSDRSIATVDADGVSLTAIQALVKRTDELRRENDELRGQLARVLQRLADLEAAQRLR